MANYGNSSLEERIERRRQRRREARRRKLIIFGIALALVCAIALGAFFLFSDSGEENPIPEQDQATAENQPETPAETPEEEPEKAPEETPSKEPSDTPEEAPTDTPTDAPEENPDQTAVKDVNAPFSFGALYGVDQLAKYSTDTLVPAMLGIYTQARAKMTMSKVDPEKPMVALTFDDGPSGKYGNRILDALEKHGARASFFVLGELIDGNSANLKRACDIGCEIGNHSYDHPNLTKLSADDVKSQINRTNELIKNATGRPATLVRTPGGAVNATVKSAVGAPIISWSLDTVDWKSRNTDAVVKIVLDNVRDGDIILMHEIYKTSAEAAEIIIPELIKRGYQLVTVSELMEARGVELQSGKVYFSAYPKKKAETETATEPKKEETAE